MNTELTEAEREALNVAVDEAETCECCGDAYGAKHVYAAVERILADRLATVQTQASAESVRLHVEWHKAESALATARREADEMRARVEAEWFNGNIAGDARDRILRAALANPSAAQGESEAGK